VKYMVWGLGRTTQSLLQNGVLDKAQILGCIDSNERTFVHSGGVPTYEPQQALKQLTKVDFILVPASNLEARKSIYHQAIQLGFPDEKLVFAHNTDMCLERKQIHAQDDAVLRKISLHLYETSQRERMKHLTVSCETDIWDEDRLVGKDVLPDDASYVLDYGRFRTLELAVKEIRRMGVAGATAELGVFRGACSRLIHAQLPKRRHYMYDSFQSFRPEEIEDEIQRGKNTKAFWDSFRNTSPGVVMQGMPSPENCIIRQGFFPESLAAEDKDVRFSLVSIDVDMEESTYQGLRFFYPRMEAGGFIFMHDYNAPAIQKAVRRYEEDYGERIRGVHMSDACGSLVIPM